MQIAAPRSIIALKRGHLYVGKEIGLQGPVASDHCYEL